MAKRGGKRPHVDLSADWTIILKPTIKKQHGPGGMVWNDLGKHRYKCRALVMDLQIPYNAVNFLNN